MHQTQLCSWNPHFKNGKKKSHRIIYRWIALKRDVLAMGMDHPIELFGRICFTGQLFTSRNASLLFVNKLRRELAFLPAHGGSGRRERGGIATNSQNTYQIRIEFKFKVYSSDADFERFRREQNPTTHHFVDAHAKIRLTYLRYIWNYFATKYFGATKKRKKSARPEVTTIIILKRCRLRLHNFHLIKAACLMPRL